MDGSRQFRRSVHVAHVFHPEPVPGVGAEFTLGEDFEGKLYVRVTAWAEITYDIRDLPLDEFLASAVYPQDIQDQIRECADDATWRDQQGIADRRSQRAHRKE